MRISGCAALVVSAGLAVPPDPTVLAPAEPLSQDAVIAGTVLDPSGRALVDATVCAFQRVTSMEGLPVITRAGGEVGLTDDRGSFRVFGLPPGEFLILARRSNHPSAFSAMTFNKVILAPTFFPGTRDLASAKPIAVGAGQEVGGVAITMVSTAGFTVSGRVIDSTQSPVRTAVTLHIFPSLTPPAAMTGLLATPDSSDDQWSSGIYSNQDGTFSIGEVPSGAYEIVAAPPMEGRRLSGASMRLTIDKDIAGLQLVLAAP